MSLGLKILKNTTYLTLGDKFGYVLQFIFFLYFAKKFGVIPTGEYSFAFFYAYALSIFSNLGLSIYLVREVAAANGGDRKLFISCLIIRILATCFIFSIGFFIAFILYSNTNQQKLNVIYCWGIYWFFYNIADAFTAELTGHEKMVPVALLGFILKLMSAAFGMWLIYLGLNYDIVMIAYPISSLIYLVMCTAASFHYLGALPFQVEKSEYFKKLLNSLIPFFLALLLTEVLFFQDVLILGFIKSDKSVGLYSSAIKIISFILGVSVFLNLAILPVLSKLYMESREKLIQITETSLRLLVIIGLPMSFGLTMTSDKIIDLLYSERFLHSSIILQIASWTILMGFIQALFSAVLTAIDRQKEKVVYMVITFILSLILYFSLISVFDFLGAAIAFLITSFVSLIFFVRLVSRYLFTIPIYVNLMKPALACIIMSLFLYFLNNWDLILLIPLAAVVYMLSLFVLGALKSSEIAFIKETVPLLNR